jgi:hypothetical protein
MLRRAGPTPTGWRTCLKSTSAAETATVDAACARRRGGRRRSRCGLRGRHGDHQIVGMWFRFSKTNGWSTDRYAHQLPGVTIPDIGLAGARPQPVPESQTNLRCGDGDKVAVWLLQ